MTPIQPLIPQYFDPEDFKIKRCQSAHLKKLIDESKKEKSKEPVEECLSPPLIMAPNLSYEEAVVMD